MILNMTWGIIQTLIGFAFLILTILFNKKLYFYEGCVVSRITIPIGVSLGLFVFVHVDSPLYTVKHEYGHCIQSAVIGPFYLITVGIISPIRSLWTLVMWKILKIRRLLIARWYYNGWPENQADKLGDVNR